MKNAHNVVGNISNITVVNWCPNQIHNFSHYTCNDIIFAHNSIIFCNTLRFPWKILGLLSFSKLFIHVFVADSCPLGGTCWKDIFFQIKKINTTWKCTIHMVWGTIE
jgi:hypothetical protein